MRLKKLLAMGLSAAMITGMVAPAVANKRVIRKKIPRHHQKQQRQKMFL